MLLGEDFVLELFFGDNFGVLLLVWIDVILSILVVYRFVGGGGFLVWLLFVEGIFDVFFIDNVNELKLLSLFCCDIKFKILVDYLIILGCVFLFCLVLRRIFFCLIGCDWLVFWKIFFLEDVCFWFFIEGLNLF